MSIESVEFKVIEGPNAVRLEDVAHAQILGRGRVDNGMDIDPRCVPRVNTGAAFYHQNMANGTGSVLCSGYKTPADKDGGIWTASNENGLFLQGLNESFKALLQLTEDDLSILKQFDSMMNEQFQGRPEAYSMFGHLLGLGVPASRIRIEPHSICTVTNLARAEHEGYFGRNDERPVAIISQEAHLVRALKIARRVLRRDYIGVVAPEFDKQKPDKDTIPARITSGLVCLGINPNSRKIVERVDRRSRVVWAGANLGLSAAGAARTLLSGAS